MSYNWHNIALIWASQVAQLVKNLPAMQETQIQSLGQEDPLEKEMATQANIPAWRIQWILQRQGSRAGSIPWGHRSPTWLSN